MTRSAGLLILGLAVVAGCRKDASPPAARHTVTLQAMGFQPDTLRAHPGDTIVWVNHDIVPHTTTANDSTWDSGQLNQGEQFEWIATDRGDYPYLCSLHPVMTGVVQVE